MPDDKRPKPSLDLKAESVMKPAPKLELPGGSGSGPQAENSARPFGPAAPAVSPPSGARKQPGGRFMSHLLAGLVGGIAVAAGFYLASTQRIPGVSLTDPETRRQLRLLEDRTASLDQAVRQGSRPIGGGALSSSGAGNETVNEIRARLDGLAEAARSLDQTVQTLSSRLDAAEQRTGSGAGAAAFQAETARQIAPLTDRIASVERELQAVNKAQNERQADARAAALTLALTNLKRAVADGRPFSNELAAVENLSTSKLSVSQLEPYKDQGVASLADLQQEFSGVAKEAIERYYRTNSGTLVGQVISRAKAAIQVKPGDNSGNTIEATLGRVERELKAGNLKGALIEVAAVPSPAAEAMQGWIERAQARAATDDALRKTDQELLAVLTRPAPRRQ